MPNSIPERLSALDASFLAVESPLAPMHVGWVASFDPPDGGPTTAEELIAHIAERLEHAHRYRQKLADVPLGIHDPVWVDDPDFDPARHLHVADGDVVDEVFSTPLPRDRPLWEMWVLGDPPTIVGKAHHCMVDGTAVVELGNLMLDAEPDAPAPEGGDWAPSPEPNPGQRLGRAIADRIGETAGLLATPLRLATNLRALPGTARMVSHTVLPPAPPSPLNLHGSGRRHHTRVTRSLDQVRTIRRAFGVTPNDVVLAACAGGLHTFLDPPGPLKVMVPADVRSAGDWRRAVTASRSSSSSCRSTSPTRSSASRPSTAPPTSAAATRRPSGSTTPSACSRSRPSRSSARSPTPSPTRASST